MQSVSYQKATETGEKRVLLNYHTGGEDWLIFSPQSVISATSRKYNKNKLVEK